MQACGNHFADSIFNCTSGFSLSATRKTAGLFAINFLQHRFAAGHRRPLLARSPIQRLKVYPRWRCEESFTGFLKILRDFGILIAMQIFLCQVCSHPSTRSQRSSLTVRFSCWRAALRISISSYDIILPLSVIMSEGYLRSIIRRLQQCRLCRCGSQVMVPRQGFPE